MQNCGVIPFGLKQGGPLLGRFVGKLAVDVLPAALASLVGGFLFTQYQYGHPQPAKPAVEQIAPASTEMMQLLRDEHVAIVDYLKTQAASEKTKLAAQDQEDARAIAEAKAAEAKTAELRAAAEAKVAADAKIAAAAAARRSAVAALAAKTVAATTATAATMTAVTSHAKPVPVAVTTHAPLVIARADQPDGAAAETPRDPNSLIAKTLDLKDHVVAATKSMVSAIGDIPGWLADRIGGGSNAPSAAPAPRPLQLSDAS